MDLIFWGPWAIGAVIFILWIKRPISEFRQLLKDRAALEDAELKTSDRDSNEQG
ncbi:MAG: hypothetical protein ACYS1A_05875 [Planctomycetota bacterium]|jgi:hypothetical protein